MSAVLPLCVVALLLGFLKGAFGGRFGMLGVPLLALVLGERNPRAAYAMAAVIADKAAISTEDVLEQVFRNAGSRT